MAKNSFVAEVTFKQWITILIHITRHSLFDTYKLVLGILAMHFFVLLYPLMGVEE